MKSDRTRFFPLEFRGVGTADVENLRSYAQRLALAHRLNPTTVLSLLLEEMPLEGEAWARPGHRVTQTWTVHGGGSIGRQLAERLTVATSVDVTAGTMSRFVSLPSIGMTVKSRVSRYCPLCVAEPSAGQLPHGRLLWMLNDVAACPRHCVKLRDAAICGAPEAKKLEKAQRPQLEGVCGQCGSIGFKCLAEEPVELADPSEVWVADQVGRLVACTSMRAAGMTSESLRAGVLAVIDARYEGKPVRASREVGLAKATVWSWIQGENAPGLSGLIKLCMQARCELVGVMEGKFIPSDAPTSAAPLAPRAYRRSTVPDAEIRAALREAALAVPPLSGAQLAKQLKMDAKSLRSRFQAEFEELQAARRASAGQRSQATYDNYDSIFTGAVAALIAKGKAVTRKSVQKEAGMAIFNDSGNRSAALSDVLARVNGGGAEPLAL